MRSVDGSSEPLSDVSYSAFEGEQTCMITFPTQKSENISCRWEEITAFGLRMIDRIRLNKVQHEHTYN